MMKKRSPEEFFWKTLSRYENHFVFWKAFILAAAGAVGLAGITIGVAELAGWSDIHEGMNPGTLLVFAIGLGILYNFVRAVEGAASLLKQAGVTPPSSGDSSSSTRETVNTSP